jgi:hypothetical protein
MLPTESKNAAKRLTSAHFETKRHELHPAGSRSHKRRKTESAPDRCAKGFRENEERADLASRYDAIS